MDDKKTVKVALNKYGVFGQAWATLNNSYRLLESKFWTLIIISLIGSAAYLAGVTGLGFATDAIFTTHPSLSISARLLLPVLIIVLSVASIVLQIWSWLALVTAANNSGRTGILKSYRLSKDKLAAYSWAGYLLITVIVAGTFFFIIPGIVASVWFVLTSIVVVTENRRGLEALFTSKELIKDHWRQTAAYMVCVGIIITALTLASLALQLPGELWLLFINTLSGAFFTTSLLALYRELSAVKTAAAPTTSKQRQRMYLFFVFIGTIVGLFMIIATTLFGIKFKDDISRISEADQIQQALTAYDQKQTTYPQTLSQLVPDYLSAVPVDPASGQPYGYALTDGGKDYVLIVDYDNFGTQALTSSSNPVPAETNSGSIK
jgi:hypothetical protein